MFAKKKANESLGIEELSLIKAEQLNLFIYSFIQQKKINKRQVDLKVFLNCRKKNIELNLLP